MAGLNQSQTMTVKEIVAGQLASAMREKKMSKKRLAEILQTSRWQLNRILDSESDVKLSTLERAAVSVGRSIRVVLHRCS